MPTVQPGARIGPYRVEAVLPGSRGGFAQIVTARRVSDSDDHQVVAIKIARTEAGAGLEAEAFSRALGQPAGARAQVRLQVPRPDVGGEPGRAREEGEQGREFVIRGQADQAFHRVPLKTDSKCHAEAAARRRRSISVCENRDPSARRSALRPRGDIVARWHFHSQR